MTGITELSELSSEELLTRLLSSDSEDWKIKDILRRRRVAGEKVAFGGGHVSLARFVSTSGPPPVEADNIYQLINDASIHELAKLMKAKGYSGQNMDGDNAATWIELAAADPFCEKDVAGFDKAKNFWAAAKSKFKRWLVERGR